MNIHFRIDIFSGVVESLQHLLLKDLIFNEF